MQQKSKGLKESTAKLYESALFDSALGDTLHPGGLKLTARAAEVAKIDKASFVLDIASGKGTTAFFLSQEYGCSVIGIDLSERLISLSQSKAKAEGLLEKVHFVMADGESLPFRDSVFGAVISECSFSLLPDKGAAAREVWRILKPGGTLVITDIILRGRIPEDLRTRTAFAACIAGARSLEDYIKLFEEAGFQDPYIEDHTTELKRVAYRILVNYGSMEGFSAKLPGELSPDSAEASADAWRKLFTEGKPGYALIALTRH